MDYNLVETVPYLNIEIETGTNEYLPGDVIAPPGSSELRAVVTEASRDGYTTICIYGIATAKAGGAISRGDWVIKSGAGNVAISTATYPGAFSVGYALADAVADEYFPVLMR